MSESRTIDENYHGIKYVPIERTIDEHFHKIYNTPDVIKHWIYKIVTPDEEKLIYALEDGAKNAEQLAEILKLSLDETNELLKSAYHRTNIDKSFEDPAKYVAGNLYNRLGVFTQYEQEEWQTVPREERKIIDEWYLDAYEELGEKRKAAIVADGKELPQTLPFLPIKPTVELIEALGAKSDLEKPFFVVPCNCRTTTDLCDFSRDACINALSKDSVVNRAWDRGHGKKLTTKEVVDLLYAFDKEGLMHEVSPSGHICNCESCCCYPTRVVQRKVDKGEPVDRSRIKYIAEFDKEKCVSCGICVKRCHFKAFKKGEDKKVEFSQNLCWGCGICECACPKGAIKIVPYTIAV
jgi:Pyruvate/2-oxoacid:ferredoxin oxidoreductase delta subunit